MFDPQTNRFLSVDPIEDGTNWYIRTENDPINFRDTSGLSPEAHPLNNVTLVGLSGGYSTGVVSTISEVFTNPGRTISNIGRGIGSLSNTTASGINNVSSSIGSTYNTTLASGGWTPPQVNILSSSEIGAMRSAKVLDRFEKFTDSLREDFYNHSIARRNFILEPVQANKGIDLFGIVDSGFAALGENSRASGDALESGIEYVTSGYGGTTGDFVAGVGGFLGNLARTSGNIGAVVDLPRTLGSTFNDFEQAYQIGNEHGFRLGAGHLLGTNQIAQYAVGNDFYGNEVGIETLSDGLFRLSGTAASGAGVAKFANRGLSLGKQTLNTPTTLEGLRTRIDIYANRAQLKAFDKGLSGIEAGNYADRYFNKAVNYLDRRLVEAGSEYRLFSQYGLDVLGRPLTAYNRPAGSIFLDAALTDRFETTVFSGWDTRFQSTPYPRWNRNIDNALYINRFQIQEGFVREISVEARRP